MEQVKEILKSQNSGGGNKDNRKFSQPISSDMAPNIYVNNYPNQIKHEDLEPPPLIIYGHTEDEIRSKTRDIFLRQANKVIDNLI